MEIKQKSENILSKKKEEKVESTKCLKFYFRILSFANFEIFEIYF